MADEVEDGGLELVIDDYTTDGTLVETTVERFRQVNGRWQHSVGGVWVTLPVDNGDEPDFEPDDPGIGPLGSKTLPAPDARSGCRTVWGRVWIGYGEWKFYHLENRVRYCYNKATHKVSGGSTSWDILETDGISDVGNPNNTIGYYTWFPGVSNSGYKSLRQWPVSRTFSGVTHWYYPRVNIYGHSSGTVYVSWRLE